MRHVYETPENLKNEQVVAEQITSKWDIKVEKLKPLHHFDYAFIHDGKITGFLEIKCRTFASNTYWTYMISLEKVMRGMDYWERCNLRVILAVHWTDRIGWCNLEREGDGWEIVLGGRNDREDDQDMEPVVLIPVLNFKNL
jgi:hypothetical protein